MKVFRLVLTPYVVVLVIIAAAFLATDCKPSDPPGYGLLVMGIQTELPSSPTTLAGGMNETLQGLTALDVTVTRVDVVHRTVANDASTEHVITVDTTTQSLSLSGDLQDTSTRMLASLSVPVGYVFEIRFITSALSITLRNQTFSVKLPSGTESGLKISPDNGVPFQIVDGQRTAARVLFTPFTQLIRNHGQGFLLKPTMLAHLVAVGQLSPLMIDRVIVGFRTGTTAAQIATINAGLGTTVLKAWPLTNLYLVQIPTSTDLQSAISYYTSQSAVDVAGPDLALSPTVAKTPCDPGFGPAPNPFTMANFPNAWGVTTGSKKTKVAIIDTGFDLTRRNLLFNWTFNWSEALAKPINIDYPWTTGISTLQVVPDYNTNGIIDWEDFNTCYQTQVYPAPGGTGCSNTNEFMLPNPTSNPNVLAALAQPIDDPTDNQFDPEDIVCPGNVCLGLPGLYGGDGSDDDHDMLADDFVGFNVAGGNNNPGFTPTGDVGFDTHGTVTASVLGATGKQTGCSPSTDDTVAGAMWDVEIVPFKAGEAWSINSGGTASFYDAIIAMNAAALESIPVVSISLDLAATSSPLSRYTPAGGGPKTLADLCSTNVVPNLGTTKLSELETYTSNLLAQHLNLTWPGGAGSTVVVAATENCPFDNLAAGSSDYFDLWVSSRGGQPFVTVGALQTMATPPFKMASFGAIGNGIDVAAPGTNFTTLAVQEDGTQTTASNVNGTSVATPLVAGTLGLMVTLDPTLNGSHLASRLLCNSPSQSGIGVSGGRVLDAFMAVSNANKCP